MISSGIIAALGLALSTATAEPVKLPQQPVIVKEAQVELMSLGEFRLTAYCSCTKCCGKWANNRPNGVVIGASGEELTPNYSIAVDPDVIPYGTIVIIDGKEYKAQDCGGSIKNNRIDVYFNNHNDALKFGVQYKEVFIKKEDF